MSEYLKTYFVERQKENQKWGELVASRNIHSNSKDLARYLKTTAASSELCRQDTQDSINKVWNEFKF